MIPCKVVICMFFLFALLQIASLLKVRALSYEFLPIQTTTYEIFNRREEFREQIVSFSKYSLNHYVVTWLLLMREKSTSFGLGFFLFIMF